MKKTGCIKELMITCTYAGRAYHGALRCDYFEPSKYSAGLCAHLGRAFTFFSCLEYYCNNRDAQAQALFPVDEAKEDKCR
jgi:hypothetical protein